MSAPLDLSSDRSGEQTVLRVSGEVDYTNVGRFAEALAGSQADAGAVVLDLRGVEFLDSMGLGAILEALLRAQERGKKLAIMCGPAVERVLEAAGLRDRVPIERLNGGA